VVFLAAGGIWATTHHETDLARYAPRKETVTLAEAHWLANGWEELPLRRLDLLGDSEERISLQVAADPETLAAVLAESDWQPAPRFAVRDLFLFLSPATPLDRLPPLPLMESGRLPSATFIRSGSEGDRRMVIRLWPTNFLVRSADDRERPLLVGSITGEQVVRPYDALTMLDTRLPSEDVGKVLEDIVRSARPRLSAFERSGPAGPVLLVAPQRAAAEVSSTLVRPEIGLAIEEGSERLGGETLGDRASFRQGIRIEPLDDQVGGL
jgi:hypothetical protein